MFGPDWFGAHFIEGDRPEKNEPPKKLLLDCARENAKDFIGIGLDIAGLVPVTSVAGTLGQLTLGGASITNSGPSKDVAGIGLGIAGFHFASPSLMDFSKSSNLIVRNIPGIGTAVGTVGLVRDGYNTYNTMKACMNGSTQ